MYGFQAYGLDANSKMLETVSEIASQNILDMQTEDPIGPYYIGGYSFGAIIAYEMAIQLERSGFEVAALYAFDGFPIPLKTAVIVAEYSYTESLLSILDLFYEFGNQSSFKKLSVEDLEHLPKALQLSRAYQTLNEADGFRISEPDFIRFVTVYLHQSNILKDYNVNYPELLTCNVHLFRVRNNELEI